MRAQMMLYIFLCVFFNHSDGKFLGGTINWRLVMNKGVRFTYRLAWQYGTGPYGPHLNSSLNHLGNLPTTLSHLKWACTSGCHVSNRLSHDVNYYVTYANISAGWEQGENIFFYKFVGNGPFEISLDGIPWADNSVGRMMTSVYLGARNDTGSLAVPNASPLAAPQSLVGIQIGCVTTLDLPVDDPDADTLRCRLATPTEGGSACTTLPRFTLNEVDCTLTIDATSGYQANTLYRVTIMVEDYPDYTITVGSRVNSIRSPMNKIPVQFTVQAVDVRTSCQQSWSTFVYPGLQDGFRFSYASVTTQSLKTAFYLHSPIKDSYFVFSIPAGMKYELLPDDRNRADVQRIMFSMKPDKLFTRGDQRGDTMICVWSQLKSGLQNSDKRCITALVNDFDECKGTSPCRNGGSCVNLFGRWTCKCRHGFKPKDCSAVVTCADFPCKNNGTCMDISHQYVCSCGNGYTGLDCETATHVTTANTPVSSTSTKRPVFVNRSTGVTTMPSSLSKGTNSMTVEVAVKESDILPIALSVVGGLLGLLTLVCCCLAVALCATKQHRKKNRLEPVLNSKLVDFAQEQDQEGEPITREQNQGEQTQQEQKGGHVKQQGRSQIQKHKEGKQVNQDDYKRGRKRIPISLSKDFMQNLKANNTNEQPSFIKSASNRAQSLTAYHGINSCLKDGAHKDFQRQDLVPTRDKIDEDKTGRTKFHAGQKAFAALNLKLAEGQPTSERTSKPANTNIYRSTKNDPLFHITGLKKC